MRLCVEGLKYRVSDQFVLSLENISLSQGDTCLILGASGSGKTTLLSLLTGLATADEGSIRYDDVTFSNMNEADRDQFRGQNIGVLFQTFHLIRSLTTYQNIMLPGLLSGKEIEHSYIESIMERLGLIGKKDQKTMTLSVGESQRVALARALATKPKWLFCDEPTSALDDNNTSIMLSLIQQEVRDLGASLIIVTHDSRVRQYMNASQLIMLEGQ